MDSATRTGNKSVAWKVTRFLMGFSVAIWIPFLSLVWYEPPSPYVPYGTDSVEPSIIRVGDRIGIYRTFEITKKQPILITRSMIHGTCPYNCEIVGLTSDSIVLEIGKYEHLLRYHTIPSNVTPGTWTLLFTAHYKNILGRTFTKQLPSLQIEVVPN